MNIIVLPLPETVNLLEIADEIREILKIHGVNTPICAFAESTDGAEIAAELKQPETTPCVASVIEKIEHKFGVSPRIPIPVASQVLKYHKQHENISLDELIAVAQAPRLLANELERRGFSWIIGVCQKVLNDHG